MNNCSDLNVTKSDKNNKDRKTKQNKTKAYTAEGKGGL